jgi:membrane protein
MVRFIQEVWGMVHEAVTDFFEDNAPQQGAALAFYSLLSLAPLLVISLAVAAFFFDENVARDELDAQLQTIVGDDGAKAALSLLKNAKRPDTGILATVLGFGTLLFGASGVFGQLQAAMNAIWDVPPSKNSGIWDIVRGRFLSFAMVLVIGFLLLASLVLSAVIAGAGEYLSDYVPGMEAWLQTANTVVSFAIITVLFAMIFKVLPDTSISWRDVWIGALLTSMLFSVGKLAIGLYLGKSGMESAYGTAGSLVVLIVWVYYSAQILFFGAELTHVYARRKGSKSAHATESERARDNVSSYDGMPQGMKTAK